MRLSILLHVRNIICIFQSCTMMLKTSSHLKFDIDLLGENVKHCSQYPCRKEWVIIIIGRLNGNGQVNL